MINDVSTLTLGHVTLTPNTPVVAGSMGQWTICYTVGSYGVDEGGIIKLAHRYASDWQKPQFDRPQESGYTSVVTDGQAKLISHYETKGHHRPWMKAIVIDVYDGCLAPGDTVTITLGDRTGGSPGMRSQTFHESLHEFIVFVDPTNACNARRVPDCPTLPVVAGRCVELICIVPTQTTVGAPVEIFVKGQDEWFNPTAVPNGLTLAWEGNIPATIKGNGLVISGIGHGRITAKCGELLCTSNPITAYGQEPKHKHYWGDLHAQAGTTIGTGTDDEYFTFGRDQARLDFISHQGNDFQISDQSWTKLNETVRRFHEDHRYVVFPGYEWSANTPAGGDRNVFYLEEDLPIFRSSHWQIHHTIENDYTPAHPASELFDRLHEVGLDKVICGAHIGGRYADIRRYFDQELSPLIELTSCWGIFEWLLWDAIEQGYVIGIMCNSDGHKGRPGAEGPGAGEFGIAGGLTCVLAEDLTRISIFNALKERRCYGTTGPRMDLAFTINGHPMGSCIAVSRTVHIQASIKAVSHIESLILYQGKQVIAVCQPPVFMDCAGSRRVRVSWQGAKTRGRGRRVNWDGVIRVDGAHIENATTFAFDSTEDDISAIDLKSVRFKSQTNGDTDGIDLILDQADTGQIIFESPVGSLSIDLAKLNRQGATKTFEGINVQVSIHRYPEFLHDVDLFLNYPAIPPPNATTPFFVKGIQCDGHMAWSSPIYVTVPPD